MFEEDLFSKILEETSSKEDKQNHYEDPKHKNKQANRRKESDHFFTDMNLSLGQMEFEHHLLSLLDQSPTPLGAVNLSLELSDTFQVSQATIGRRLLEMDHQGLTKKCSSKGRTITKKGLKYLDTLFYRITISKENEQFLRSIDVTNIKNLTDLLVTRQALESSAASLAAENATREDIGKLWEILKKQQKAIESGGSGFMEDKLFHSMVAKSSKNKVMLHTLNIIRNESKLSPLMAYIRKQMGRKLLSSEHQEIIGAIENRDGQRASAMMKKHLQSLLEDIHAYFKTREEEETENA